MSLRDWQEASNVEIDKILEIEPNINDTPLLGALMVIANYGKELKKRIVNVSPQIDFAGESLIDRRTRESEQYYDEYVKNKALYQQTRLQHYDDLAEKELEKMLRVDEDIMIMLHQMADAQEKEMIKKSYKNTLEKLK